MIVMENYKMLILTRFTGKAVVGDNITVTVNSGIL